MATHVGIIHKGGLLFQGPLQQLQQMKSRQSMLEIETNDNGRALEILSPNYKVQIESLLSLSYGGKQETAAINRLLVNGGVEVYSLHPKQNDLEQLFIEITSDNI
jgi:ABC-2 type transport system ATP-binding protein